MMSSVLSKMSSGLKQGLKQQIRRFGCSKAGSTFDFDTPYNRFGWNSARWDKPAALYPEHFKYGMAIASMDFQCDPSITEAICERLQHHNHGYAADNDFLKTDIIRWNKRRHGGLILAPEQITLADGVYPGVIAALRSFVPRGGKVLLTNPVYNGFYTMANCARVETVSSPLVLSNGRYEFDFDDLEAKMTPDVHAVIVNNPQNPTGNVWTGDELLRIGEIALKNKVIVLADELHSDFVRKGHTYTAFASLPNKDVVNNSVTFNSISKTFSIAGMKNAYYYSKNPTLLARVNDNHKAYLNTLGVLANHAAYNHGGEWADECAAYLDDNHTFVEEYFPEHCPSVKCLTAEGTFLAWLDFSQVMKAIGADEQTDFETPELFFQEWLVRETGVYLEPGSQYGPGGEGHMRLNIASSRIVIEEVLEAIKNAVNPLV